MHIINIYLPMTLRSGWVVVPITVWIFCLLCKQVDWFVSPVRDFDKHFLHLSTFAPKKHRWFQNVKKKKKSVIISSGPKKIVHPTTGPAVDCGCIIVSKPSICLQEYPPKQVTFPTPLPPNPSPDPGHHHFSGTIHLHPAINSLHFLAQAINPGTLN